MFGTFLDAQTLFTLFNAPGPAVERTIAAGGWSGMLWPGHPAWVDPATLRPNDLRTGDQLLSLALHYFTVRHPEADALQICTAAQVLASNAVGLFGGYPVDEYPMYEQAEAWLLSLAGGVPPAPGESIALTPPYDVAGRAIVPGGDIAAFTLAIVGVIEALVFTAEAIARDLAEAFLRQAGDPAAQRAADIFQRWVLGQVLDLDAPVVCVDCGAAHLDVWYTGQTWGETLCEACYATRVQAGQARRGEA